nr:MAG TPA: hypothetical protein [Bacteriophage sp.]
MSFVVCYVEVRMVKRCGLGVSCFTVWYYRGIS